MGAATRGTVEFLDLLPAAPEPGAGIGVGIGGRVRWPGVLGVLLVVAGFLAAARWLGATPAAAPAVVGEAPVFAGEVALPADFGAPVALAAAATDDDIVWALGARGQVARVADGRVTATSAGRGYHGIVARPDGRAVYVTTGTLAPTVVALDPFSLEPGAQAFVGTPVSALAAGGGTVWTATADRIQQWSADLRRPLVTLRLPAGVNRVSALAVVGPRVLAVVTTTPGTSALLLLASPGGPARLTSAFTGPVSVVPGAPALVAHVGTRGSVEVRVDPSSPGAGPVGPPLPLDAAIWPATHVPGVAWTASTRSSGTLDCFDAAGRLVGRMAVGDRGHGVDGPVVTTSRAVYAVTRQGEMARGGHGSCETAR